VVKVNKNSKIQNQSVNDLKTKIDLWAHDFLHSPAGFDGRRPQDIIDADLAESRTIFKKELLKRKAIESMKSFKTSDGLDLKYWFVSKPGNAKVKILVHGSGSNFAKAERAVNLLDRDFNVAMISYRGHSGNPGKADQKTIIRDVKEAIEDVVKQGYKIEDVYLEGSSLGTASIAHAMNRIYQASGNAHQFGGLLLKAAPLNLNERDKDTVESLKAAGIDYEKAQPYLRKLWNQEEAYVSIRAKQIRIVHGTKDDVVPVEHAERIKTLLDRKNDNVDLKIIDGEGHRLNLDLYGIY
jgi:pimeloyl-ACP methyl ester carboxylesterase